MAFVMCLTGAVLPVRMAWAEESCEVKCPGAGNDTVVMVDLNTKCMKVGFKSFKVTIGAQGPQQTANSPPGGTKQKLEGCKGGKYHEVSSPTSNYDRDCLKMGIPANDSVGKWIHKTSNCQPGGGTATRGCIAVPCEHWVHLVTKAKGKMNLVVCNGSQSGGSGGAAQNGNTYSGETESGGSSGGKK